MSTEEQTHLQQANRGMAPGLLHEHIESLPSLVREMVPSIAEDCQALVAAGDFRNVREITLFGCGDSHHAAVGAELAFLQLARRNCRATTAMHFSRYLVGFLPGRVDGTTLAIGISASGQVSRTIEALRLARQAGAITVAVTGNPDSPLAQVAEHVLKVLVPELATGPTSLVVPGSRSYVASQLGLFLTAVFLGLASKRLSRSQTDRLVAELSEVADDMERTVGMVRPLAAELVARWADASSHVFCGAGPNLGTAMFCAAKLMEASGDAAAGQDLEEWAHLQYFERERRTPTFIISAGAWDEDRALEIAAAALAVGRRVAIIAPEGSTIANTPDKEALLPVAGSTRECFSPLLTSLPGLLMAAERADLTGESYFRGFSGGRSVEGGGGMSRIRTSHQLQRIRR